MKSLLVACGLAFLVLVLVGAYRQVQADHVATLCQVIKAPGNLGWDEYCFNQQHADIAPLVRLASFPALVALCAGGALVSEARSDRSSDRSADEAARRSA